tara:strand:+ start:12958 stop:14061 length:1104 start_codon:yes stop_codon:yes gene_type:complete
MEINIKKKKLKVLLVYAVSNCSTLSYHVLWPKNFKNHKNLKVHLLNLKRKIPCNKADTFYIKNIFRPDVIVLLHSVFANGLHQSPVLFEYISSFDGQKVFYLTNFYKNMPEKMKFCESLGINIFVQLGTSAVTSEIFRKRLNGIKILNGHAGALDQSTFFPGPLLDQRPIDIGFRGMNEPWYFGHQERSNLMNAIMQSLRNKKLVLDCSMDEADRFVPNIWADFLRNCKAQLGTESGTDFFDITEKVRYLTNNYTQKNKEADFNEVYDNVLNPLGDEYKIKCRLISGRVIEAAASKSVLILYEGKYEGYMEPDEHYISISKDHRNLDEAMDKLSDLSLCNKLIENSYECVLENFTFEKQINYLIDNL